MTSDPRHREASNEPIVEQIERADGSVLEIVRPRIRVTASGMTDEKGAANFLGKSPRTLQRWRHQKIGPPYHDVHGTIFYRITDLEGYLSQWRVEPLAI